MVSGCQRNAIGHAVAAPERFAESLGNAYVAVFGGSGMQDAAEVGGGAEIAQPDGTNEEDAAAKPLPDYVLDAQPTLPFSYVSPLDGALTSGFGWREDPNTGEEAFHTGLDLAADEGTPFACFADGTVGVVGESTVLGKYLTVRHADGYETLYAHCSKITVSSGQSVLRGDTLGAVGATGNATGAHLHFGLQNAKGELVDPLPYLRSAEQLLRPAPGQIPAELTPQQCGPVIRGRNGRPARMGDLKALENYSPPPIPVWGEGR